MASQKTLEHYLRQLRLIEEHREKWCEENVRRHYRDLDKDLKEFLGVQYAELAENDQLTYEILHQKGQYARFIEEVEQRINTFTPQASQEIKNTVQLTYKKCFEGMVDAVEKSKDYKQLKVNLEGVRAVTPDVVKNVVKNSFLEDALEKNHKTVIYDIKQQIGVGLTQGDRMSTMAKRISEQIDSDYKKSVRIARTECHRVREAGFQDSSQRISEKLQESGSDYVMTKTWKTMQDMAVRPYRRKGKKGHKSFVMGSGPNHVKMQGVTVLVDEPFDLGDGYTAMTPGQSGIAGHDINCRCYLSRDLMTKAEYEKLTGKKIESKPVIKPKENEILETQEQGLLDEKNNLEKEKEKYIKRQQNLESDQHDSIRKETVTPADYEANKNGLEDDTFSQKRKDAAYWFEDETEADKIIRPHTSDMWQKANADKRNSAWDYTADSDGFNRPLRGYDGSWYDFKGVGKVPLDNEGKEQAINHLTELIDKSTYDFDIWLQRAVNNKQGAISFLGITDNVFNYASEKDLQNLLVGKTVKDEAFISCSAAKEEGFGGPLILNIYAPKGTKMIYAEPFSEYGSGSGKYWDGKAAQSSFSEEFEMIIQRGTVFKITKVEKSIGRLYVDVDVIKQI